MLDKWPFELVYDVKTRVVLSNVDAMALVDSFDLYKTALGDSCTTATQEES